MKKTTQADNITMSAGGLYSLATIGAKDVIDKATPRVLDALDDINIEGNSHWCFSDMGCADGGTSLGLWDRVINRIRESDSSDIQIVYADQANNDFNALVQILHGHTQFESYLPGAENVHALESGSSFYSAILPKGSLHLGFSATAMHWLSKKPSDINDHIHMVGAVDKDKHNFAEQAQQDWQTILLKRSRELSTGGKLVLVNFCIDEQGCYLGNTGGVNMFDNFNQNWQQWLDQGVISAQEYQRMTLPQYYNTVDEFSAPLLDKGSEVYRSGLRLVNIETAQVPCPFAADFSQHEDAQKFAKAYIPTIRSWNESTFLGALSTNRSLEERRELIEAYYALYEDQVASHPEGHGMGYVHAYMTIEKV
ncbi:MAG: hypothetical protein AB8B79_20240 [Granulosicoccus sp.]